jgi:cathepsin L
MMTMLAFLLFLQYSTARQQSRTPCLVMPMARDTGIPLPNATDDPPDAFVAQTGARFRTHGLPFAIDYRETAGVVTPVRDQGECGSCWAFSATEAMEGQLGLAGLSRVLAPQTFVDCVREDGGCNGGWPDDALAYAEETGIAAEADYPYRANESGVCKLTLDDKRERVPIATRATVFYEVRANGSDDALRRALWQHGPLAIAIDASDMFQSYTSGVLNDTDCSQTYPNHAVLLVGYSGTTGGASDYWIVKNSWGPTWGEKGYIRFSANTSNICGIGMFATVPYIAQTMPMYEGRFARLKRHLRHVLSITNFTA